MVKYSDEFKRPSGGRGPWQMVAGKHKVYLLDPKPEDFEPWRVAMGLASESRYAGNYGDYRVAQHSVLVQRTVGRLGGTYAEQYAALHHEDAESVTGDCPQPVKSLCPDFKTLEGRLDLCVMDRFGNIKADIVKEADRIVFVAEVRVLSGLSHDELREFYGEYGDPSYRRDAQPRQSELILWSRDEALRRFLAAHEYLEAFLGR